jgi:hypothetical protein
MINKKKKKYNKNVLSAFHLVVLLFVGGRDVSYYLTECLYTMKVDVHVKKII